MDLQPFLPGGHTLQLCGQSTHGDVVWLTASSCPSQRPCPSCQQLSGRVHSRYTRVLKDVSLLGRRVRLHLIVRKFFCRQPECPVRVFCERLSDVAAAWGRTTLRLADQGRFAALEVGAASAARVLHAFKTPLSADTLLSYARRRSPDTGEHHVRHLGVDDWAWRKGHRYGTVLVDLDRHQVIELLPDRDCRTLAAWLSGHPEIQVITRDRAGAYQEAAAIGAPQAQQVADRWHLVKNLRETLERYLQRLYPAIRTLAKTLWPVVGRLPAPAAVPASPVRDQDPIVHPPSPAKQQRFDDVKSLLSQGHSVLTTARIVGAAIGTVRKYSQLDECPGHACRGRRGRKLDPFLGWLSSTWHSSTGTSWSLFQALRGQGYQGGYTAVKAQCREWTRQGLGGELRCSSRAHDPASLTPRALSWAMVCPQMATPDADTLVTACREQLPGFRDVEQLVRTGWALLRRQAPPAGLPAWLTALQGANVPELRGFATGLDRDFDAVRAAVELSWSNGQVEGQVNRLKTIKRSMYGRAHLDLLTARVLHHASG